MPPLLMSIKYTIKRQRLLIRRNVSDVKAVVRSVEQETIIVTEVD